MLNIWIIQIEIKICLIQNPIDRTILQLMVQVQIFTNHEKYSNFKLLFGAYSQISITKGWVGVKNVHFQRNEICE